MPQKVLQKMRRTNLRVEFQKKTFLWIRTCVKKTTNKKEHKLKNISSDTARKAAKTRTPINIYTTTSIISFSDIFFSISIL